MEGDDSTVINQVGEAPAQVLTGRHQDTVWGNIDHTVRHAHPDTYQGTALLSTVDQLKTMTRPTNAYIRLNLSIACLNLISVKPVPPCAIF
jgi:hypothetical protein